LLITIRSGQYGSLERVLTLANTLFLELEQAEAKSGLPEKLDRARVSKLVGDAYLDRLIPPRFIPAVSCSARNNACVE
jgi:hypothetical protein